MCWFFSGKWYSFYSEDSYFPVCFVKTFSSWPSVWMSTCVTYCRCVYDSLPFITILNCFHFPLIFLWIFVHVWVYPLGKWLFLKQYLFSSYSLQYSLHFCDGFIVIFNLFSDPASSLCTYLWKVSCFNFFKRMKTYLKFFVCFLCYFLKFFICLWLSSVKITIKHTETMRVDSFALATHFQGT